MFIQPIPTEAAHPARCRGSQPAVKAQITSRKIPDAFRHAAEAHILVQVSKGGWLQPVRSPISRLPRPHSMHIEPRINECANSTRSNSCVD